MKRNDLITPEGTGDLLFEDCAVRRLVQSEVRGIFESRGYCEVVTPTLEFYDVFNQNSSYFPQESLYKLIDNKGRLLVVRPDCTMPIARVVATRLKEAAAPIRLYYNQRVCVSNPSMTGRSDEVLQAGIELIGSSSKRSDLEVLTMAVEVLSKCDSTGEFRLEIGDIGFYRELINQLPANEDIKEDIRRFIEAKNYPALNDLLDSIGDTPVTSALKQLPRLFGGVEVFERAASLFSDERTERILSRLKDIYSCLSALGFEKNITVDLGIVNRTDYYTGVVMKGYLQGYGAEVLSGGRYDKLISDFGYDIPATGFAVNIDAVSKIIRKLHPEIRPKTADVLIYGEDGYEMDAVLYSKKLIADGYITEIAVADELESAYLYALEKGIKQLTVVGEKTRSIALGGNKDAE